ncbi:hypothetical protein B0A48_11396 [Cryoendolithus antarcticus]|uniref:Mid2 domain-containing protein n=1 Tax=Cryoendolithus antarcticus TaxID=1507870 RepID=A0A1V8SVS6_9PEZI|nr:hypothetical protein B0A48_11396 [Cryoendolithus antarcticus]
MNVTWYTTYSSINLYLIYGGNYDTPTLCISGTSDSWWMWEPIDDHGHNALPFVFRVVDALGTANEQQLAGFITGQFWLREAEVVAAATTSSLETPTPGTITVTQSQSIIVTSISNVPTSTSTTQITTSPTSSTTSTKTTEALSTSSMAFPAATASQASDTPVSTVAATFTSVTSSSSTSSTSTSTPPLVPAPKPTLAIGLGAGVGIALLAVGALACFFVRRRRAPPQHAAAPQYMPELANDEKPSGYATPSCIAELHNRRSGNTLTKSPLEAASMTSPRELYGDSPSAYSRGASPVYGAGTR